MKLTYKYCFLLLSSIVFFSSIASAVAEGAYVTITNERDNKLYLYDYSKAGTFSERYGELLKSIAKNGSVELVYGPFDGEFMLLDEVTDITLGYRKPLISELASSPESRKIKDLYLYYGTGTLATAGGALSAVWENIDLKECDEKILQAEFPQEFSGNKAVNCRYKFDYDEQSKRYQLVFIE